MQLIEFRKTAKTQHHRFKIGLFTGKAQSQIKQVAALSVRQSLQAPVMFKNRSATHQAILPLVSRADPASTGTRMNRRSRSFQTANGAVREQTLVIQRKRQLYEIQQVRIDALKVSCGVDGDPKALHKALSRKLSNQSSRMQPPGLRRSEGWCNKKESRLEQPRRRQLLKYAASQASTS